MDFGSDDADGMSSGKYGSADHSIFIQTCSVKL